VQLAALEFRKLARMPQKRQDQIGEQMPDHLERHLSLARCFEPDAAAQPALQAPRALVVRGVDEAEAAAEQLRVLWAIGGDAIAPWLNCWKGTASRWPGWTTTTALTAPAPPPTRAARADRAETAAARASASASPPRTSWATG
jgi:hypothetical protein